MVLRAQTLLLSPSSLIRKSSSEDYNIHFQDYTTQAVSWLEHFCAYLFVLFNNFMNLLKQKFGSGRFLFNICIQ